MLKVNTFTFNNFKENTYLIFDSKSKELAIIDPGCMDTVERSFLLNFIKSYKLVPKYLLNTHCHLDHIYGNSWVANHFNLKLHAHTLETENIKRAKMGAQLYNVPTPDHKEIDEFIDHDFTFMLGDYNINTLFTPGHSKGHLSFYSPDFNFVVSGDVLFEGSVGRTDLNGGDFNILTQSIRNVLYKLPENTKVYPGHGNSTTIKEEKMSNPFVTFVES